MLDVHLRGNAMLSSWNQSLSEIFEQIQCDFGAIWSCWLNSIFEMLDSQVKSMALFWSLCNMFWLPCFSFWVPPQICTVSWCPHRADGCHFNCYLTASLSEQQTCSRKYALWSRPVFLLRLLLEHLQLWNIDISLGICFALKIERQSQKLVKKISDIYVGSRFPCLADGGWCQIKRTIHTYFASQERAPV